MNLEAFINRVIEITNDSEIRTQLERGLKVQFNIGKEKTKVVALRPKSGLRQERTCDRRPK